MPEPPIVELDGEFTHHEWLQGRLDGPMHLVSNGRWSVFGTYCAWSLYPRDPSGKVLPPFFMVNMSGEVVRSEEDLFA